MPYVRTGRGHTYFHHLPSEFTIGQEVYLEKWNRYAPETERHILITGNVVKIGQSTIKVKLNHGGDETTTIKLTDMRERGVSGYGSNPWTCCRELSWYERKLKERTEQNALIVAYQTGSKLKDEIRNTLSQVIEKVRCTDAKDHDQLNSLKTLAEQLLSSATSAE